MDVAGDVFPHKCSTCAKKFSGPVPAKEHFQSSAHKKKVANAKQSSSNGVTNQLTCYVCSVSCDTVKSLEQHQASQRHLELLHKQQLSKVGHDGLKTGKEVCTKDAEFLSSNSDQREEIGFENASEEKEYDFDGQKGYCYLCKVHLTSLAEATQHLNGVKHQKAFCKLAYNETREQVENNTSKASDKAEPIQARCHEDQERLYCKLCDFQAESLYAIIDHLKSSEHDTNVVSRSINLFMSVSSFGLGSLRSSSPLDVVSLYSAIQQQEKHTAGSRKTLNVGSVLEQNGEIAGTPNKTQQFHKNEKINKPVFASKGDQLFGSFPDISDIQISSLNNSAYVENAQEMTKIEPDLTFDRVSNSGYCGICDVDLTSKQVLEQHINGRKHKKARAMKHSVVPSENEQQLIDVCLVPISDIQNSNLNYVIDKTNSGYGKLKGFICVLCNVHCSGVGDCKNHIKGEKHAKKVQAFRENNDSRRCKICNSFVDTLEQLVNHQKANHPEKFAHNSGIKTQSPAERKAAKSGIMFGQTCQVECSSEQNYNDHLGNMHKNFSKPLEENDFFCVICEEKSSSEQTFKHHSEAQNHINRMKRFKTDKPDVFLCNVCNIESSGFNNLIKHLKGDTHRRKLKKNENGRFVSLFCNICNAQFSSDDGYTRHLSSDEHVMQMSANENGHDLSDVFVCHLCEVECPNEATFQQHLLGRKHRKKLAKIENVETDAFFCAVCNLDCSDENSYKQHLLSMKHSKEMAEFGSEKPGVFSCGVCNTECTGEISPQQHLMGEKHKKKVAKLENNNWCMFFCHVCNVDCVGEESYNHHLLNESHKKQMAQGDSDGPDVLYCGESV